MSATVEAENLSRFYGVILGLNNVSFSLQPGLIGGGRAQMALARPRFSG